jgi:hypothetical protein
LLLLQEASIAQGRTILNPEEVDFSLGYTDGTIDAQLDRFGATSIVAIDDTTINTSYVQGYIEGFYNTYLSIYGVAPW